MIKYENQCCQCAVPSYPCAGEHKRVPKHYCDGCETDEETLYYFEQGEYCINCIKEMLDVVE